MKMMRELVLIGAAASLAGCFGGKAPPTLFTVASTAPDPQQMTRSAGAGQAVTIANPIVDKALRTNRVAVDLGTQVKYVKGIQLVDYPDRLFQQLVSETVRRTTNRVVLDPGQSTMDPGLVVTGTLQKFGYDGMAGQVVVQYDAALSTQGGTHVEARRFTATAPADGTNKTVPQALNQAANQVAMEVARWIGG